MEDSAIVELYWQRADEAIPETERKYGRYCRRIAYNITASHEDAEECVNDTWLGAWNAMPDKRPSVLSTFLGYITRNFALNRLEARRSAKRGGGEAVLALDELEDCIPADASPQRCLEQKELEAAALNRQPTLTPGAPPTAKQAEAEETNRMRKYFGLPPIK